MIVATPMLDILLEHRKNFTSGTDIKTVKNRAGHTRIETTMSYTHPLEEFDRQAADVFKKFF